MKSIRITEGTYGYRPGDGNKVVPVDRGQCCEVSDEEATRLVSLKVAEYVEEPVATPDGDTGDGGTGTDTPDKKAHAVVSLEGIAVPDGLDIVDGHFDEEGLSKLTNNDLKKLATDLGLDPGKCKKKDDFVALLLTVKIESEEPEDGDDGGQPPKPDGDNIVP